MFVRDRVGELPVGVPTQNQTYRAESTALLKSNFPVGSRDGAVVRAFVSHQCGPGLIPRLGIICGLS